MDKLKKKRLEIIDIMQGIAMLWVIIGHHLLPFMPASYASFHYYIYAFHMPLFIAISGFLMAYSYKNEPYKSYLGKRFKKFFLPYVVVGTTISLMAGLVQGWQTLPENLMYLLCAPLRSEATFLWYIYLLFIFYGIYPMLYRWVTGYPSIYVVLLFVGLVGYFNPLRLEWFCLLYFTKYFLFFLLGVWCGNNSQFLQNNRKLVLGLGNVGLMLFLLLSVWERLQISGFHMYGVLCFSSLPAMYALGRWLAKSNRMKKVCVGFPRIASIYIYFTCFLSSS